MRMKKLACFILSLLLLTCVFAVNIENAFATYHIAVIDKIMRIEGAANDFFGYCVAISDKWMAVGSNGDVYIYDLTNGDGTLSDVLASELKLTGLLYYDAFGYSVAISGDKVVVGAPSDDEKGLLAGSAYIYDLSSGDGELQDILDSKIKLTADDGAELDYFGCSVAISGNRVAVGADNNDNHSGSVYIYNLSEPDVPASEIRLIPGDASFFGCSVAVSGDRMAVGSNTGVYIYDLSNGDGELQDLLDSELKLTARYGTEGNRYGCSVAISGDKMAVGAPGDFGERGSAYIYDLSSGDGELQDVLDSELKLTASDGSKDDNFGHSVAISGDRAAISGGWVQYGTERANGSAYIYDLSRGNGGLTDILNSELKLTASDGSEGDEFGCSVAISGDKAAVGAYGCGNDNGSYVGAVYIYTGEYTVTFDKQSGSGGDSSVIATYTDLMPSASAPLRAGYTFDGYYSETGGGGTKYYNADMSSAHNWDIGRETTLYANWAANSYTATFDKQGGIGGDYTAAATYDSAMPPAAAPTRHLYTFQGYFTAVNGGGEQYYNADMSGAKDWDIAGDKVLYAYWTESSPFAIDTSALPAGTLGKSYSGTVTTSGGYGDNTWYASGLPEGLGMETATGRISGKPNETGDFSIEVTVYGGEGRKASKIFTLTVNAPSGTGKYKIIPENDSAYTVSTEDGFTTLTIKSGVTGFRYIRVSVNALVAHEGQETCVFVHMRNGVQIGFSFSINDFDSDGDAGSGFNVKPDDIIKVYIIDELSNSAGKNPVLLQ